MRRALGAAVCLFLSAAAISRQRIGDGKVQPAALVSQSRHWNYWSPTGSNDDGTYEPSTHKCSTDRALRSGVDLASCEDQDLLAFIEKYVWDLACPSGSPCATHCATAHAEGWAAPCLWQMIARLDTVCDGSFNATVPSRRRRRLDVFAPAQAAESPGSTHATGITGHAFDVFYPGDNSECGFNSFCMYCNASEVSAKTAHVCDAVADTGCNWTNWDFAALPVCVVGARSAYANFSSVLLSQMCSRYFNTTYHG